MRKNFFIPVLFTGLLVLLTAWNHNSLAPVTSSKPATSGDDSVNRAKDILPLVNKLNSNENYRPKQNFRKGHVTPATLSNYLEKTADGYCIKLPNNTNVPTPAVVNGSLLLSGGFGSKQYYSFDAQTGQLKWGINLDDDGPSSPAIKDNIIVFNTESCTIFACDLITGVQKWSYWLGDPLMSMPAISNGLVFTSYPARYEGQPVKAEKDSAGNQLAIFPTHVLIAFDLKTGAILWQKWIDSDIMSAPMAKDDMLYVTTFSGALYKVKQKTGEILEAKATRATSVPVFDNSNQLIYSRRADTNRDSVASEVIIRGSGSGGKELFRKDAHYLDEKVQVASGLKMQAATMDAGNGFSGGAPLSSNWQAANSNIGQSNVATLQSFQGSRGLYKDGLLYNTMGDEIVCTGADGKQSWKYALKGDLKKQGGFLGTPPVYVNGYLIIATLNGEVLLLDAKDGKEIKKYNVKDPVRYQPVAVKGWIYVTTVNSKLYAINTGNPKISGWNMWGGNAERTNVAEDDQ